jgi:hypothetical protein
MQKRHRFPVIAAAAGVLFALAAVSAQAQGPAYMGAEKCGKMCHKVEYNSWLETKHAKAWDSLKPEEQAKEECASCHQASKEFKGVQCESCHGPGADYGKLAVMKDPAKAKAAGLLHPDEKTCKKCHNEKSPHYKGFNFAEMVKKVHDHKPKPAK